MNGLKFFSNLSSAQKIALSFLVVIGIGTLLLSLPISNQSGKFLDFIDAFFISASCTCVTGLSTVVVSDTFSLFGQIVMLILIQIGGLGFLTLMAFIISMTKDKLSIKEKTTMKEMLNNDRVLDMKKFIQDIIKYTFIFEGVGAFLISFTMIPKYGFFDGLFKSIFLAVSAFCNAGFDPLGATSLQTYLNQPFFIIIIMFLIILGGLGFAIWFELKDQLTLFFKKEINFKKLKKNLSFHTKVVLFISLCLIVVPALIMLILEWNNPNTIGNLSVSDKILAMFFESVALRTAGFTSINYAGLHPSSCVIMIMLMLIGGSPGGTAGGIKTTTILVIVLHIIAVIKQKEKVVLWKKSIEKNLIMKAMGIFYLNIAVFLIGLFILSITFDATFLEISFEVMSALATVGSSLGITASLNPISKLVIIVIMYIGRIGIITLLASIVKQKNKQDLITYPNGNIII